MPTLTEDKVNLVSHLETQHVIEDVLDSKNCEMKKNIIMSIHLNLVPVCRGIDISFKNDIGILF